MPRRSSADRDGPGTAARGRRGAAPSRSCRLGFERCEPRLLLESDSGHMAVGMNLENVVDWSPAWTFTDAFKASRPWISHVFNTQTWATSWDPAAAPVLDLDADPWFNMPHMADDTFVRNFATYVRDHLEPGRTAYVEWANELWNFGWGFEASAWVDEQARAGRIVRVAAGQAANAWIVEQVAAHMGGTFDAIALAPYITFTDAQRASYTSATTVDRILADAWTNVTTALEWTRDHAALRRLRASEGQDDRSERPARGCG